jgi:hypothetical protein
VALFYSSENLALQVATELRGLGHDVLTSLAAARVIDSKHLLSRPRQQAALYPKSLST